MYEEARVSLIAWMDTSPDEQRRVREIVALFADKGTLDELGIGQIRDAFSDCMFPGTSTIQTRARYLLFVPWLYQRAAKSSARGSVRRRGEGEERRFITTMKFANQSEGLIGRQAGVNVRTLPSAIYWSALARYGILTSPLSIDQVGAPARVINEADELVDRIVGDWCPTLPPPPPSFPHEVEGGFDLTAAEAGWLRDRILLAAPGHRRPLRGSLHPSARRRGWTMGRGCPRIETVDRASRRAPHLREPPNQRVFGADRCRRPLGAPQVLGCAYLCALAYPADGAGLGLWLRIVDGAHLRLAGDGQPSTHRRLPDFHHVAR